MHIYSWNINSIRARHDRLLDWLHSRQPDVVCLQELKCTDEQFPAADLADAGYQAAWFGQRAYNGVAILARQPLELADVERGLGDGGGGEDQARVLTASVSGIRIFSIYAPNGQAVGSEAYEYKLDWYQRLRRVLDTRFTPNDPLLLAGDFNVAPDERDVWDPVLWEGNTLFSRPERDALVELEAFGLVDTFRMYHDEAGRFTFWDYQQLGFPRNHGLRIDHILVTRSLAARVRAADIDREARKGKQPSDHAPVSIELA